MPGLALPGPQQAQADEMVKRCFHLLRRLPAQAGENVELCLAGSVGGVGGQC
ncbi:hypothetical protein [Streptomyces sp. NPDC101149]|uniref:hypothetical protein n=1 Tax=Streptomyces sp. NPDC101149 TaxID=3366113 RepID=UPI00380AD301